LSPSPPREDKSRVYLFFNRISLSLTSDFGFLPTTKIHKKSEEKKVKNYTDSDYAANKNAKGIVYRFADVTVEITMEIYLRENPGKTEKDFAELKALSDSIYLKQDREEYQQTRKNVSLHGLDETEVCSVPSPEDEVIEQLEQAARQKQRRELAKQALGTLTEVQRRRYLLYHVKGLTMREIADMEKTHFTVIHESLQAAEKKIKIFLAKGLKTPLQNAIFFTLGKRTFHKPLDL